MFPVRVCDAHAKCATPWAANFSYRADNPHTLVLLASTAFGWTRLASRNLFANFATLRELYSPENYSVRPSETKFFTMYSRSCGIGPWARIDFREVRVARPAGARALGSSLRG